MTDDSGRGLPAERTGLAWQRSALGAGVVSLLLLYHTAHTGWSALTAAAACTAVAAALLTVVGTKRDREFRRGTPREAPRSALLAVAVLVSLSCLLALVASLR
ncbi:DUF202 domain-containing protein [Saccharomonospora azurea]|uniref:DUF202 domain-containing protein n=1 Tax=Saccharomonospora azurea NA-128 TaxID=882081 RepID=H8GEA0_9PSEU|nr:DUF202 domain-containing protein [Saccharomonospora azurea]EHY90982.1 hypothetical protein SacazDRAFT_04132 [Saccharomonospora azurea NA-128]